MRRAWIAPALMAAALIGLDLLAARETWRLATETLPWPTMSPGQDDRRYDDYVDGRSFEVRTNGKAGTILSRTQVRDWTWTGQANVWWPVASAGIFNVATWFARRRGLRAILEVVRPTRPTIGRGMVLIAILGGEFGATSAWLRSVGADPMEVDWGGLLLIIAGLNLLALLPIGIALSYRRPHACPKLDPFDLDLS